MKVLYAIAAIVGFALPLVNANAHAAELKVFESNALKSGTGDRCDGRNNHASDPRKVFCTRENVRGSATLDGIMQ